MKLEANLIKLRLYLYKPMKLQTVQCTLNCRFIIRHVHEDKIRERFLGFYAVNDNKSAARVADVIVTALNRAPSVTLRVN